MTLSQTLAGGGKDTEKARPGHSRVTQAVLALVASERDPEELGFTRPPEPED